MAVALQERSVVVTVVRAWSPLAKVPAATLLAKCTPLFAASGLCF